MSQIFITLANRLRVRSGYRLRCSSLLWLSSVRPLLMFYTYPTYALRFTPSVSRSGWIRDFGFRSQEFQPMID